MVFLTTIKYSKILEGIEIIWNFQKLQYLYEYKL